MKDWIQRDPCLRVIDLLQYKQGVVEETKCVVKHRVINCLDLNLESETRAGPSSKHGF